MSMKFSVESAATAAEKAAIEGVVRSSDTIYDQPKGQVKAHADFSGRGIY
jgi:hypothetical protein